MKNLSLSKSSRKIGMVVTLAGIALLLVTLLFKGIVPSFIFCFSICILLIWRSSINYERNIVVLFFCVSVFTFLIAAPVANLIFGYEKITAFSDEARKHFYVSVSLSLACVWLGYYSMSKFSWHRSIKQTSVRQRENLLQVSKWFFIITYTLKTIQYLEIAYNTYIYGYMYYYTEYSSFMPSIIVKISDMYIVGLVVYLACLPKKKECFRILSFYCIGSIFVGIGGRRFDLISALALVCVYLIMRNKTSENGQKWISKKQLIFLVLLSPILILILMLIGSSRGGRQYSFVSLGSSILEFMGDIGNSGKVVMRAYENATLVPKGRFYSIGSIIEYFEYNEFSKLLFGTSSPDVRTIDYAMNGHSLAYLVTYLFSASSFFSGHGQGSCYIAELYADFGYVGIAIGSLCLGIFMRWLLSFQGKNVFRDALALFLIAPILRMPRDTYCMPLTFLLNFKYLFAYAFIFLIASQYKKKTKRGVM